MSAPFTGVLESLVLFSGKKRETLCFSLTHYLMVSTSVEGGQQKESVWAH